MLNLNTILVSSFNRNIINFFLWNIISINSFKLSKQSEILFKILEFNRHKYDEQEDEPLKVFTMGQVVRIFEQLELPFTNIRRKKNYSYIIRLICRLDATST